jgi:hypothetical protein
MQNTDPKSQGEPIEEAKGGTTPISKLAILKKRQGFAGDIEDIIGMDWSNEWTELQ